MTHTILLADDHRELRDATAELLHHQGYRVLTASDGEEAWQVAAAGGVDLLITDLDMPRLPGLALVDRLRARQPELPVLVVSSQPSAELLQRQLRGELAFLAKPYSSAELRAALRNTVGTRSGAFRRPPDRHCRYLAAALVAATLVLVGLALAQLPPAPPPLPARALQSPLRSARLEPLAPVGPVATRPIDLSWQRLSPPHPANVSYLVKLEAVDGTALWQATVAAPPAHLPAAVREGLQPAVTYYWRVEAHLFAQDRLAWSERTPFRILPPGGP